MGIFLEDKIILVTGGTEGIGYETVINAEAQGAKVIACARKRKEFTEKNISFFELDVTDSTKCREVVNKVINKYGRIDGLVANAGITHDALTPKMSDEDFNSVINTNVNGVFNLVREIGPIMERQSKGSIVTVSSVVGEFGNIGQVNYAASKAAIIGMTKSWAKEFSRKGAQVRVNSVAPGYTMTKMLETVPENLLEKFSSMTMLKRLARPEEIANAILFLISDYSSYITGTVLDVNGGMRL